MPDENKVYKMKVEGTKLKVTVDPNKDGEPVLELSLELSEVLDEIAGAFKKD